MIRFEQDADTGQIDMIVDDTELLDADNGIAELIPQRVEVDGRTHCRLPDSPADLELFLDRLFDADRGAAMQLDELL